MAHRMQRERTGCARGRGAHARSHACDTCTRARAHAHTHALRQHAHMNMQKTKHKRKQTHTRMQTWQPANRRLSRYEYSQIMGGEVITEYNAYEEYARADRAKEIEKSATRSGSGMTRDGCSARTGENVAENASVCLRGTQRKTSPLTAGGWKLPLGPIMRTVDTTSPYSDTL